MVKFITNQVIEVIVVLHYFVPTAWTMNVTTKIHTFEQYTTLKDASYA